MIYTFIAHTDEQLFEAKVQEHLNDGWSLQGGIATTTLEGNWVQYAQAMTIPADKLKEKAL